ncbi:MAG TPA: outer membrane lipid asymmetry maintenance protein MlaD [Halothiobacillaceae bacterium]|nr:outer membrane lipid asymmetry maintenance protein MlaD [Halothiobacillaceae bacterium]
MHAHRYVELIVGLFVLAGAVVLMVMALSWTNFGASRVDGYRVIAKFDNVGGLTAKAPVKMSGLTIGRVESISMDPDTFEAVVVMQIRNEYDNIPTDTFANIYTAGLLGSQYIELSPGGSFDSLTDGDQITMTQSAFILESVISRFLFDRAQD